MEKDKTSRLNTIVIYISILLSFIGLMAMLGVISSAVILDERIYNSILGASLFIVGSFGLIVEVLIYNLNSLKK